MKFNKHFHLVDKHAPYGASKASWLNYTDEKLELSVRSRGAAVRGTRIHKLAQEHIELGIDMPVDGRTINSYINDAIGHRMTPEVTLFFSENIFGTADAIGLHQNILRIFDLKTGINAVKFTQLRVYAALFCLEYGVDPRSLEQVELRIYQNDAIEYDYPEAVDILDLMERIRYVDTYVTHTEQELAL